MLRQTSFNLRNEKKKIHRLLTIAYHILNDFLYEVCPSSGFENVSFPEMVLPPRRHNHVGSHYNAGMDPVFILFLEGSKE